MADLVPDALIFAIDEWDNEVLKASKVLNKNYENSEMFERVPFFETFMVNTWSLKPRRDDKGRWEGVIPMRMKVAEGLEILSKHKIWPDLVYWESSHQIEDLSSVLDICYWRFPAAIVCGDCFNFPLVAKAVASKAKEWKRKLYVEMNKCWILLKYQLRPKDLEEAKTLYPYTAGEHMKTMMVSVGLLGHAFMDSTKPYFFLDSYDSAHVL